MRGDGCGETGLARPCCFKMAIPSPITCLDHCGASNRAEAAPKCTAPSLSAKEHYQDAYVSLVSEPRSMAIPYEGSIKMAVGGFQVFEPTVGPNWCISCEYDSPGRL